MEDTAHQSPRGDTAEEPFGHVEPGSGVWREVHMETRMPPKHSVTLECLQKGA